MTSLLSQSSRATLRDLILLSVLISVLFGIMLGNRPLSVPDEGRYVEIAREMVNTGDYVTPRLNGVKYFEKPALVYWLESLSIKLFGLREFTLRLCPALFALAGCLAVYLAGKRLYGRRTGLISAAVLATSILYYGLSRAIILDMSVTVLMTITLLLFVVGVHEPAGLKRRLLLWGFYASAALAVLAKGLIGIVIPGIVITAWIVLLGEWRVLRNLYIPSGVALFLLIAAPWHIVVSRANPEFFNFYFVHEHFLRYLTKIHRRYEPAWFFIPVLLLGFFPWTAFLVQSIHFSMPASWHERHEQRHALFLILWALLVFLFFSASDSKLVPYILPVFPPLAILVGRYLAAAGDSLDLPGVRAGLNALLIMMLALGLTFMVLPAVWHMPVALKLDKYPLVFAVVLCATGIGTWFLARARGLRSALPALVTGTSLFLILINPAATGLAEQQSTKPLAMALKPRLLASDEVACYDCYYQDLPVYLERRITVVNWEGELDFGMTIENTTAWMIDANTFWKRWHGSSRVYMFTRRNMYDHLVAQGQKNLHLIGEHGDKVLVTNKEIQS